MSKYIDKFMKSLAIASYRDFDEKKFLSILYEMNLVTNEYMEVIRDINGLINFGIYHGDYYVGIDNSTKEDENITSMLSILYYVLYTSGDYELYPNEGIEKLLNELEVIYLGSIYTDVKIEDELLITRYRLLETIFGKSEINKSVLNGKLSNYLINQGVSKDDINIILKYNEIWNDGEEVENSDIISVIDTMIKIYSSFRKDYWKENLDFVNLLKKTINNRDYSSSRYVEDLREVFE